MSKTTLFMISHHEEDTPSGTTCEWFTTFNKAMAFARRERIADNARFDQVEIPRTRLGLCDWLNKNFHTDNG